MQNSKFYKDIENKTFIFLFSIIPITFIVGQAITLFNIFLISIFIVLKIIFTKNFIFIKKDSFILLVIIYLYLIFNTLISIDYSLGILRNLGFIRLIVLFIAINFLFYNFKNQDIIFKIWCVIVTIVIADSLYEFFIGKNLFGFGQDNYSDRIVSFFKDEPIVGAYLNGFFFLIIGFLFNHKLIRNKKFLILCFILTILFLICITLIGERSNTIKANLDVVGAKLSVGFRF